MARTSQKPSRRRKPRSKKQQDADDQPLHKLLRDGTKTLSDVELLTIVLHDSGCAANHIELLRDLLAEAGGLVALLEADAELLEHPAIDPARAAVLIAAREIVCRMAREKISRRPLLDNPGEVAEYLNLRFHAPDQEVLGALFLDVHNRLIAEREIFRGTLSRATVEPRPILKEALRRNAAGFLLFHTHPSGDPAPSVEDLRFTRRMAEAGELLGLRLVDHLILGARDQWVSLRRRGAW